VANNLIKLLLKIDDKGSLTLTTKDAKKTAKALDDVTLSTNRLNKSTAGHNKQQKGVAGATANSTKAFSKMTTGMTGGLVPAYAVLAANIFALTAAFGALNRAAQFEKLREGLEFTGNAAGVSLGIIVDKVTEITGAAVSAKAAMESVAIGVSAGFDSTQIAGLAKVAKGASLALGRDLGDALDRLTRGAAKLEPEILDELGIMVRLDSATEKYAISLGKGVEQLTQFQRRQAFVNDILDQGARKFGDLSEAIDTNPYDKLSATFFDVSQAFINVINVPIVPFVNLLAENAAALSGVMLIFGSTLLKTVIGPLTGYTTKSIAAAVASAKLSTANLAEVASLHGVSKAVQVYQKALEKNNATQAQAASAVKGASTSIALNAKEVKKLNGARGQLIKNQNKSLAATEANNIAIAKNTALLKKNKLTTTALSKAKSNPLRTVDIAGLSGTSGKVKELQLATIAGTATTEQNTAAVIEAAAASKALEVELELLKVKQIQLAEADSVNTVALETNTAAVAKKTLAVQNSTIALNALKASELSMMAAVVATTEAEGLSLIAKGRLIKGSKALAASYQLAIKLKIKEALANTGIAITAKQAAKQVNGLAIAGKGLLASLGPLVAIIGIFLLIGAPLYSFLKDKFFPEDLVKKRLEEATEAFDNFAEVSRQFESSSSVGADRMVKAYTAYSGILSTIRTTLISINALENPRAVAVLEEIQAAEDKLANLEKQIGNKTTQSQPTIIGAPSALLVIDVRVANEREINRLGLKVVTLKEEFEDLNKVAGDIRLANLTKGLNDAIKKIQVAKALEGPNGLFNIVGEGQIEGLTVLLGKLGDKTSDVFTKGVLDIVKFEVQMAALAKVPNTVRDSFQGADDAVSALGKSLIGLKKKQLTPLGDTLANAKQVQQVFKDIAKLDLKLNDNSMEGDIDKNKKALNSLKASLEKKLASLPIIDKTREGLDKLIKDIEITTKVLRSLGKSEKSQVIELKNLKDSFKGLYTGVEATLTAQNDLTYTRLSILKVTEAQIRATVVLTKDEAAQSKKLADIEKERSKLISELIPKELILAKAALQNLNLAKQHNKALVLREVNTARIIKLEKISQNIALARGARLTDGQEFELAVRTAQIRVDSAERMLAYEQARGVLVYRIMELELTRKKIVGEERALILQSLNEQLKLEQEIAGIRVAGAKANLDSTIVTANRPEEGIGSGTRDPGFGERSQDAGIKGEARIERAKKQLEIDKQLEASAREYAKTRKNAYGVESAAYLTAMLGLKALEESTAQSQAIIRQEYINTVAEGMAPFLESLRALGPDGESVAALAEGSLQIASALSVIATEGAGAAAKLDAASSVIGSLMSMHAAKTSAIVAGIDKEIEAEKRRDGQSARSLAKIASLEKKSEKAKRKAFDVNKKMMMAQTIINTAAAIMGYQANPGFPAGIPLAIMAAVMGAAQLAVIAGTSFQGGSGSAPSGPTSVSIGSRSNTVDTAKSTSPSGELGYFRGDSGTGSGATNYVPTGPGGFAGRATGGNVAFPVGEQGVEMFIPDRPGTIVPADEVENLTSGATNVTFQINTIDSQGMEDALAKQRGNIIKMIREAANDHGELFLEAVSTFDDEARL